MNDPPPQGENVPPPPPPPPPPTLAEVMAQQTQLLNAIAAGMNRHHGPPQNDFQRKLEGFLKLRPPTFDGTDSDPLAADDWLKEMEKKLDLTTCSDEECVGIASHQLTGAARAWWDNYTSAHEDPARIDWDEFTEAFRDHHIPEGVMEAKENEFRNISQGADRIHEYTTRFNCLLRYAPASCVSSEKEKMYYYRKGLQTKIRLALSGNKSYTLRELIDRCIEIEKDRMEARQEFEAQDKGKKRRSERLACTAPPQRQRTGAPPPFRTRQGPFSGTSRGGTNSSNYHRPAQTYPAPTRAVQNTPAPATNTPRTSNWKAPATATAGSAPFTCFGCGKPGHRVAVCPDLNRAPAAAQGTPNRGSATRGRLNHMTAEEAEAAPDAVYGTFLVQGNMATVLFDSGATCSYISSAYARKHNIPVTPRANPILTSSPLGTFRSVHICRGVIITIEGLLT